MLASFRHLSTAQLPPRSTPNHCAAARMDLGDAEMAQLEESLSHDQWEAVPGRELLWARVVKKLHANPKLRSILVVPTEFDLPDPAAHPHPVLMDSDLGPYILRGCSVHSLLAVGCVCWRWAEWEKRSWLAMCQLTMCQPTMFPRTPDHKKLCRILACMEDPSIARPRPIERDVAADVAACEEVWPGITAALTREEERFASDYGMLHAAMTEQELGLLAATSFFRPAAAAAAAAGPWTLDDVAVLVELRHGQGPLAGLRIYQARLPFPSLQVPSTSHPLPIHVRMHAARRRRLSCATAKARFDCRCPKRTRRVG